MNSSKVKALVIVFVVLLCTSVVAVGCKSKASKDTWVNTNSLPGQTFKSRSKAHKTRNANSNIVYLGSSSPQSGNFGPGEVSFEFSSLR